MTIFEKWARIPARKPIAFYLGAAALIVAMTVGIYKQTFHYGYLDWDDNTLVEQNPYVIYPPFWQHTLDLFVPHRTPGPHLPLRTATYIFDREVLAKGAPPAQIPNYHHIVNVFLYALNGLLLLWVLRKVLPPWAAVIAALIWVAHPVHVEGVCWVSGRKEMLAGGFVFASLLSYMYGTEKLKNAGGNRPLLAMAVSSGAAFLVSWMAIRHPGVITDRAGVLGLLSLAFLLVGCVAYGVLSDAVDGWKAGSLLALSVFFALCGALSKPVAICIMPILAAWEIGFRPRVAATKSEQAPFASLKGALSKVRDGSAWNAITVPVFDWIAKYVGSYEEFWGLVSRMLPQAMIALWGAVMTVGLAGKTQVLKEATWNAAPKSQNVASFVAAWLDIYHLVAPLDLSSLYDVKSDHWYWQAYAGLGIMIAIPILAIWLIWRNPKSFLWLAFWLVPLIPVSGYWRLASAHADRYLYLPAVALAVGLGLLLATAAFGDDEETGTWERVMAAFLVVAIVGGFSVLSFKRAKVWERDDLLWGDAVAKNPDLPSARNNYGAALMNAGKVDQALEQYYAAYKILPTLDVAQFNIAATELRKGNANASQKYAEEFSEQHKEMPTGWILLGQVYTAQARQLAGTNRIEADAKNAKAMEAFKQGCEVWVDGNAILQLQDKASSCNQLAVTRSATGDDAGALAAWDEGLKFSPGNRQLILNRSRYWRSKKMNDKALADLRSIESSGDPDVYRNLAQANYDMGMRQQALEYMELVVKSGRYTQRDVDLYNVLRQQLEAEKNAAPPLPVPGSEPAKLPVKGSASASPHP